MTNEQFSREYHLLDRLTQGAVVTHHAQTANGAMVMVHFLRGAAEENTGVMRMVDALSPERRARILTVADVDGTTAIVTKFILDFTTLHDWLASGGAQPVSARQITPVAPATAAPPATPVSQTFESSTPSSSLRFSHEPRKEPGEFTRMFRPTPHPPEPQQPGASAPNPSQARAELPPSISPAKSPSPPSGPGEFTLLFRGPVVEGNTSALQPKPEPAPPPVPTFGPATPAAPSVPSVPQQHRQTPSPPREQPPIAPRAQPPIPPREQSPIPRDEPATPPRGNTESTFDAAWSGFPAAPPPVTPPPPPAGPGEYTRLFGDPAAAAPPPRPPTPPPLPDWGPPQATPGQGSGDSYFDRLVGGTPASTPRPQAQNPKPPTPSFSGPSEFTRIVSSTPAIPALTPPAPKSVVPPPLPAPAGAHSGDRVLLFSLIGVVVLAIILVAVFLIAT